MSTSAPGPPESMSPCVPPVSVSAPSPPNSRTGIVAADASTMSSPSPAKKATEAAPVTAMSRTRLSEVFAAAGFSVETAPEPTTSGVCTQASVSAAFVPRTQSSSFARLPRRVMVVPATDGTAGFVPAAAL